MFDKHSSWENIYCLIIQVLLWQFIYKHFLAFSLGNACTLNKFLSAYCMIHCHHLILAIFAKLMHKWRSTTPCCVYSSERSGNKKSEENQTEWNNLCRFNRCVKYRYMYIWMGEQFGHKSNDGISNIFLLRDQKAIHFHFTS